MRLSDFKDEKAIVVVADLLEPIGRIVSNDKNKDAKNGTPIQFAAALLRNNPADVKAMLAILDDKDPAEYTCTAATVMRDCVVMLNDHDLMSLFGLRSQTAASSGSASVNTEAPAE